MLINGYFDKFLGLLLHYIPCAIIYSIKGFILSHAQSMYTEVSYQGMWKINGWGEMDQNTIRQFIELTKSD